MYKDLRNGYFHKSNIRDWNKIETIRNSTFEMFFLLLAGKKISEDNRITLKFPMEIKSDYYKLCEYVNFHSGEPFILEFGDGNVQIMSGYYDELSAVINDSYIGYSGVYFKKLGKDGRVGRFPEDKLPLKISLGKLALDSTDMIKGIKKVKTIYENGKFVGPSIAEEEKLDY